jgi:hypothetical protein
VGGTLQYLTVPYRTVHGTVFLEKCLKLIAENEKFDESEISDR